MLALYLIQAKISANPWNNMLLMLVYMYKYIVVLFYKKRIGSCKLLTNLKEPHYINAKIAVTGIRSRT